MLRHLDTALAAEPDGKPWPRLLAWWHAGRLRTIVLHGDARRTHERDVAVSHGHQLAPALARAMAAARRPVRHAVVVSDAAPASREDLCATLGLQTLCTVSRDQALGLALPDLSPTQWLLPGAAQGSPVLCRLAPAALVDAHGHSPPALAALLRQPWEGSRLGEQLHRPPALAALCGLLALAGHGHVALCGPAGGQAAIANLDWHRELAPFQVAPPAISWTDDGEQPCWVGAARALERALQQPVPRAVALRIRSVYAHLTPSERRVADVVLEHPARALEMATARLAEAAHVSQPQVIRFCRTLGFEGVKALKRALACSLAGDAEAPICHPLLAQGQQALAHLDWHRLSEAARLLAQATDVAVAADAERAPLLDLALRMLWRQGLPARPLEPRQRASAPVCVCLGAGAVGSAGTTGVVILIAEEALPHAPALQLVTGGESPRAPLLLASLTLQLLLAEIAPVRRPPLPGIAAPP